MVARIYTFLYSESKPLDGMANKGEGEPIVLNMVSSVFVDHRVSVAVIMWCVGIGISRAGVCIWPVSCTLVNQTYLDPCIKSHEGEPQLVTASVRLLRHPRGTPQVDIPTLCSLTHIPSD